VCFDHDHSLAVAWQTCGGSPAPPRLLGRVFAINILAYGARPLGSAIGAVVGGLYSAETCLYISVLIFRAQALLILMSQAVSLARQPDMVNDAHPARVY
jgi:hypothetical protein